VALDSWNDHKEQVRQATDIVELVEGYLQLRRQGRGYVGICPWHDDTRPSMQVNPERQSFKCWVCDYGGDVFSFMMRIEGIEFREALEMLADRAAIVAQKPTGGKSIDSGTVDDKQTLFYAMAWAEQQYHRNLLESPKAEAARQYLADRGYGPDTIRKFHLGFSPDAWDWLLTQARTTDITPTILEQVGLVIAREGQQGYYDRFRARVLFPIRDVQSRPIALGGRVLPGSQESAKYINSPESTLFSKSSQLYGLDVAREVIARERHIVVMEGYTDCITAHEHGFSNVVAVLGTALTERHVPLIRRFADRITLVLDGDEAGRRRANQILEFFVAAQMDLRILTLPYGADPCDFIREQGCEAFGRLLDEAVDALDHKILTVTEGLDTSTETHRASEALEDILITVAGAPRLASTAPSTARLREEQVLSRLAHRFRLPEEQLRGRLRVLRQSKRKRPMPGEGLADVAPIALSEIHCWDRELLELVLEQPQRVGELSKTIGPEDLTSPVGRRIFTKCVQLHDAGIAPDVDRLMLESEDVAIKSLLIQLDEQYREKESVDFQQRLDEVLASFARRKEDARHRNTMAQLKEGVLDKESEMEALTNLINSRRSRQAGPEPTDG